MTRPTSRIVVADANVLINLIHVARLGFCSDLPGLEFVVPEHVRKEITLPGQRAELEKALDSGVLQLVTITDPADVSLFVEFITHLGRGEAACLVLAAKHTWSIASDEKGRFRREAIRHIGEDRIIGTADLFVRAIHAGLLTVEEADADKAVLEEKRFAFSFQSFRNKLQAFLAFLISGFVYVATI